MSRGSVNKVILIGNIGQDPDIRFTQNQKQVANVNLATSEQWTDQATGQKQEKTEWHRIVFFGRLAEIVGQYLKKGSKVYIEGKLQTRKWQNQQGVDQYTTEIVANEMQMLDGGNQGQQAQGQQAQGQQQAPQQQPQQQPQQAPQQTPQPQGQQQAPQPQPGYQPQQAPQQAPQPQPGYQPQQAPQQAPHPQGQQQAPQQQPQQGYPQQQQPQPGYSASGAGGHAGGGLDPEGEIPSIEPII